MRMAPSPCPPSKGFRSTTLTDTTNMAAGLLCATDSRQIHVPTVRTADKHTFAGTGAQFAWCTISSTLALWPTDAHRPLPHPDGLHLRKNGPLGARKRQRMGPLRFLVGSTARGVGTAISGREVRRLHRRPAGSGITIMMNGQRNDGSGTTGIDRKLGTALRQRRAQALHPLTDTTVNKGKNGKPIGPQQIQKGGGIP